MTCEKCTEKVIEYEGKKIVQKIQCAECSKSKQRETIVTTYKMTIGYTKKQDEQELARRYGN